MKILMALMGLEIGGAETHVVELSKALKRKGHEIVIASNGGVYQQELEANDIKHIKVPLHTKNPYQFIKSYIILSKFFKKEHFDIVHAHARIPAFICGLLAKKHTFRFVTTAHWVFKITPLWKRLANWGEKTIAVSDDIKEYLIDNYGTWSDNISTTINGIDTNKFSKAIDWTDIAKEFSLTKDKYRILYVSRMDSDRSAVAYMVAEAMPDILKIKPNAELVIVGDGDDFSQLKEKVDAINNKIGSKAILLTGARIDINKFIAASDVFVGVSRSALEAMSSGMPVVIAGNEGYIGIFDKSKFKISYDTNYCCRGCQKSTTELIKQDLIKIISSTQEELLSMSEYNKQLIEERYSADRMASDYENMYNSLTPLAHYKHADILINGYYGYKNTGDDALLQAMIENIKSAKKNAKICVLSSNPKETSIRYGVNSIYRYDFCRIINAMKNATLFISGGGSLLQDITSTKSLIYYTTLINLAKNHSLKTMIYANGFGPITKQKNLSRVKKALQGTDYISMRDPTSTRALTEIFPSIEVLTSADPAFSLSGVGSEWENKILKKFGIKNHCEYFAVSLRDWQYNDVYVVKKMTDYCNTVYSRYSLVPVFVTMQNAKDLSICQNVSEKLDCPSLVVSKCTAKEMLSIMSKMTFSIGMRLHFLIFSVKSTTPAIGLSYDPKINSLIKYIGLDDPIDSKVLDLEKMLNMTHTIILNKAEIKNNLKIKCAEMIEKNKIDAQKAIDFLK